VRGETVVRPRRPLDVSGRGSRQRRESPAVISYSRSKPRWPWKAYFCGVLTVPTLYVSIYLALRAGGVFHAYYSQGSWEIEGGTGIVCLDFAFIPAAIAEAEFHNRLRWLPEPSGG
jgi:hypothetical protein